MPKKGSKRAEKFAVKHDPDLILLRWKALQDFSIKRFYLTPIQHFQLDDNIKTLIERYKIPYGQAGTFMDLIRKFVYMWQYLTDNEKLLLKQEWIAKGLPEELFNKVEDKYNELKNFFSQKPTGDMALIWYAELNPYPREAYAPKDEDQTTKTETDYETGTAKITPYWKQQGYKKGFLLRKLVSVFKGQDKQLPEISFSLQSYREDLGSQLTLDIPSIAITEFEFYAFLTLTDPVVAWEMPISEIIKNLVIGDMNVEYGINTSWLDMLYLLLNTANSFSGEMATLTNLNAYLLAAYALVPIYTYLINMTVSAQSNSFEGKNLSNQIPSPLVVTQI
jgi:hypothetical protein